jgi:hypothetical protein
LQSDYRDRFGQQSAVLQNLNSTLTPIFQAGPDQQGFGAQELAALNTAAGEGVGQNYAKVGRALNNQLAARGGGNEVLPSGATANLKETLAEAGAAESSQLQNKITTANYAQGRKNWEEAASGLEALSRGYDPTAFSGQSIDANKNAFGEATQIQTMKNQKESAIAGGLTSLASSALTFGAGGLANLGAGESFGEGVGDFFKGGLSALGGQG